MDLWHVYEQWIHGSWVVYLLRWVYRVYALVETSTIQLGDVDGQVPHSL